MAKVSSLDLTNSNAQALCAQQIIEFFLSDICKGYQLLGIERGRLLISDLKRDSFADVFSQFLL